MSNYSIVDIGKELQKYGLRVGENPAFGRVGSHAPGSYHYDGSAIDVTDWRPDMAPAYAGGQPISWQQRTGDLSWRAKQSGLFTEALGPGDPGHQEHVHLALKDQVSTTPEMLQWIATGRYKTPEGKLTDVMPGKIPAPTEGSQQAQSTGNVYNIFLNKPSSKKQTDDPVSFLLDYINPMKMQLSPFFSGVDPYADLSAALNQKTTLYS